MNRLRAAWRSLRLLINEDFEADELRRAQARAEVRANDADPRLRGWHRRRRADRWRFALEVAVAGGLAGACFTGTIWELHRRANPPTPPASPAAPPGQPPRGNPPGTTALSGKAPRATAPETPKAPVLVN